MTSESSSDSLPYQRTRSAVIWSHLLGEPLQVAYQFIPFFLYRDLHATVLMVALLTTLKPLVSLFSLYWSHSITRSRKWLVRNVVLTGILGRLPFLLFPFVDSPWIIIASAAFYMLTYRGIGPAWMEILNRNLPKDDRSSIFSTGAAMAYAEGVLLAVAAGMIMDQQTDAWRWIFPISSILGIIGVFFKARIPLPDIKEEPVEARKSGAEWLLHPWKEALEILKRRPDYSHFQMGFMICGSGLMVIQPALPLFFMDTLGITYTDLAIAIAVCKGLGFTLTCPLWARWLARTSIYRFSALVCAFVSLFPLLIICAQFHISWLYVAYFLYGIGQAGSHLSWNLSGPHFAGDEDSAPYSGVNVLTVGARGMVVPLIGSALCGPLGPVPPFILSVVLCAVAGRYFLAGEEEGSLVRG